MSVIQTTGTNSTNIKSDSQRYALESKIMLHGTKESRWEIFKRIFIDPAEEAENGEIPVQNYYPLSCYKSAINEIVEAFPKDFQVSGKNKDFVRKNLIENSYFKRSYAKIAEECITSPKCYVSPTVKTDTDDTGKQVFVFETKILRYENSFPKYDFLTGELKELLYEEFTDELRDSKNNPIPNAKKTILYTMDEIIVSYRDNSGERILGYEDEPYDNPFKKWNIFPVLEFESLEYDGKSIGYDLIEEHLQLELVNMQIQNGIAFHGSPAWAIENSSQSWINTSISPNMIYALRGDEKLIQVGGNLQLDSLNAYIKCRIDSFYMLARLAPPSLREKLYGTDSSGVAKLALAPLINDIKLIQSFHKKPMNELAKLILLINGEEYKDEKIAPPEEVLPVNLQEVLGNYAVGFNLGVFDDEMFWSKYFPELGEADKGRIREFYDKRYVQGSVDGVDNTNVDNNAKVAGNKKSASMSKEDRDLNVTKK